ncbi:MAG: hypothetical protein WCJ09_12800 [Planctomycetota bacterium]
MEIIVVLISELIAVIAIPAIEILVMAISLMGSLLTEILATVFTSGFSKSASSTPRAPGNRSPVGAADNHSHPTGESHRTTQVYAPPEVADDSPAQKRRWRRWIRVGGIALFLFGLIGLVAIEFIGADPMLRWALKDLKLKTGIELTFDQVSGGFLRGNLEATNIKFKRADDKYSNFDLACNKATCHFSIWTILWSRTSFESVTLEHVTGRFDRVSSREPRANQKTFEIHKFAATNCDLEIIDHTASGESAPYTIHIATFESERMRSRWVMFDTLFRSNIVGTVEGRPISITSQRKETGYEVHWNADRLPVAIVGDYLKGPFRWIDEGSVDVVMSADVPADGTPRGVLAMTWELAFYEIHASLPDGMNLAMRTVAQVAVNEMNRKIDGLKIAFDARLPMVNGNVVINSDVVLESLWKAITTAARDSLLEKLGVNLEDVKEAFQGDAEKLIEKGRNAIKKGLKRMRIGRATT